MDEKIKELIENDLHLNLHIIKAFDKFIRPRYSPLYDINFGISDFKFIDKYSFKKKWE